MVRRLGTRIPQIAALAGGAPGPGLAVGGKPVPILKSAEAEASCGELLAGAGFQLSCRSNSGHAGNRAMPGDRLNLLPCLYLFRRQLS